MKRLAVVVALLLVPAVARADGTPTKEQCVQAYTSGQETMRDGHFARARELFLVCGRDPCPAVLQKDCVKWLDDVEQRMPTLIVAVKEANGQDLVDGSVRLDGKELASRIDGHALEADPGSHELEVVLADGRSQKETIAVREAEKNRVVTITFPDLTPPPPPVAFSPVSPVPPERREGAKKLPWTFWTATGVTAVAVGSFAFFGARGLSIRSDLDSCKPYCSADRIDSGKTSFLVADISLVVALVAAGVGTYVYVKAH